MQLKRQQHTQLKVSATTPPATLNWVGGLLTVLLTGVVVGTTLPWLAQRFSFTGPVTGLTGLILAALIGMGLLAGFKHVDGLVVHVRRRQH